MILIDEKKFTEMIRKASELENQDDMRKFVLFMKEATQVDHFMFVTMPADFSSMIDIFSTYPAEWFASYTSQSDINNRDPLLRHLQRLKPVVWSDMKNLKEDEQWFMDLRLKHGIGPNGLTIPMRSSDNKVSVLSVSQKDISPEDWIKKMSVFRREFEEIGEILHSAYLKTLGITPPAVDLSPRGLDCLKLKGRGLNEDEIAHILGISSKSVKNHLNVAKERLKAANTEQALVTAIHMKLLPLTLA
jgi:DNA-binding CsgD family transcriptional regulator